ncbi:transcription regulator protein, response regulator containing CheY-like receiver domain and HTH DNA-binding domain (plasmid) [Legionella adelaidensis]|uniref:Bacterial regulatory protein, luxR family n=1 Tax=Legionella adelaidensis TaxID=45056 RepID=A0A0W0R1P9_9GAMM|nr:LuxR C-terminal-related transcriptional regulator [Legionella adelaidensis]KTC65024.1 Bacterial regulatory protein, luxR family [Legionella adelaidensis]VEH85457.1 transcription regulator protein, response regulator containing CheY-like receiver domain and HTH DNA-binding domain [Legionella adelaidensis]
MNLENTIALTTSAEMKNIVQPLDQCFNINYFGHVKIYPDNSHIVLSTNPGWVECFYTHFHKHGVAHKSIDSYQSGYFLCSEMKDQTTFKVMRDDFNIDHCMNVVKVHSDCVEIFGFATESKNKFMSSWYLNNIDLVEQFILYFKDNAQALINSAEQDRYILPRNLPAEDDMFAIDQDKRINFLKQISCQRFYQNGSNIYLTQKEFSCVLYGIKGLSSKQTGRELSISPRTVEAHLRNVKEKLQVHSMVEVAVKMIQEYPWLKLHLSDSTSNE